MFVKVRISPELLVQQFSKSYFKWLIISQNIFRCVFKGISGPKSTPGLPWTFPDFPGLLLVFVVIMSDKVILDHKKSYLISFENFHFLWFFHLLPIFAKNWKKWKFSKLTKYDFLWSKMTLSGIISTKSSKSPGKSSEVRTAFWQTLEK